MLHQRLSSQNTMMGTQAPEHQFKGMRFCKECDNMLYPKEQVYDEHQGISRLIYDCRICGHFEKAREGDEWDNCVYRSDHDANSGEAKMFAIDKDCIKDPTLQRRNDITCPNKACNGRQAVTFTQPTKDRLNLIYVCTSCTYSWKKEALDPKTDIMPNQDDEMSD